MPFIEQVGRGLTIFLLLLGLASCYKVYEQAHPVGSGAPEAHMQFAPDRAELCLSGKWDPAERESLLTTFRTEAEARRQAGAATAVVVTYQLPTPR